LETPGQLSQVTQRTYSVTEANEGFELRVLATFTDDTGQAVSATSSPTSPIVDRPLALSVAHHSLTVPAGGTVALPIRVTSFDSDDTVSVTINGLTPYETVIDNLDNSVFSGNSVTLSAAEVDSGLTLHSSFSGGGHPVNTLTVTATNTTAGESASTAAQIITVTDPPASGPSSFDLTDIGSSASTTLGYSSNHADKEAPCWQVTESSLPVSRYCAITSPGVSPPRAKVTVWRSRPIRNSLARIIRC